MVRLTGVQPRRWPAPALTHDDRATPAPVDLAAVLAQIQQPWEPRTVAVLNDYDLRVVHTRGEFTRHSHPETDEEGTPHQPYSPDSAEVLLVEPSATVTPATSRAS